MKMIRIALVSLPLLLIACIGSILIYPKIDLFLRKRPVKNEDELRSKILSTISNPFSKADTLVLTTQQFICGNSRPEELPVLFDTKLDSENVRYLLARKFQKPILTISQIGHISNKTVLADIHAEQLSPGHVKLYERYHYNNITKLVDKEFFFDGKGWALSTMDSLTQNRSR